MKKAGILKKESFSIKDFKFKDYYLLFYLIIVIIVVPLAVKFIPVETSKNEIELLGKSSITNDFFQYYKSTIITIFSIITLFFYTCNIFINFNKKELKNYKTVFKNPVFLSFFIFAICVILSTVFSKYIYTALLGLSQRYENGFIMFFYILMFYSAFDFVKDKYHSKVFIFVLILSALLIGLVGLTQFLGNDFFNTNFASKLVFGKYYNGGKLNIVFKDVYSTLYNPNTVGLYTSLVFPITLVIGIFYERKSFIKYVLLAASALMFICLLGSDSEGGLVGLFVSIFVCVIIGIILLFKRNNKFTKTNYIVISIFTVVLISLYFTPIVNNKIDTLIHKLFYYSKSDDTYTFTDLKINDNIAYIYSRDNYIKITFNREESKLELGLNENEPITPLSVNEITGAEGGLRADFSIPEFGDFQLLLISEKHFAIKGLESDFYFTVTPEGKILLLTLYGQSIDINEPIETMFFKDKEYFASGRGFLWSRSLPVIKKTILIGSGPDTFPFMFPQHDAVGKIKALGNPYIIVDKPHNLYIQTAINTGVVSLIALLVIFGIYIITTFLNIINCYEEDKYIFSLKLGVLLGILGYLVTAITTDSSVSVAPVFWAILGFGYAVNRFSKH